jgi:hypothetical protein
VGAEDRVDLRHARELVDEDRALGAQRVDDVPVVHDLVADVDGWAVEVERDGDDVDRAIDARAVAAGLARTISMRVEISTSRRIPPMLKP